MGGEQGVFRTRRAAMFTHDLGANPGTYDPINNLISQRQVLSYSNEGITVRHALFPVDGDIVGMSDGVEWANGALITFEGQRGSIPTALTLSVNPADPLITENSVIRVKHMDSSRGTVFNRQTNAPIDVEFDASEGKSYQIVAGKIGTAELVIQLIHNNTLIAQDRLKVHVVGADIDVDSDNDDPTDADPKRTDEEDSVEDFVGSRPANVVGMYVRTNWHDRDHDLVPDFADGFNRESALGVDDQITSKSADWGSSFDRVIIELPAGIDLTRAKVRIRYQLTHPDAIRTRGPLSSLRSINYSFTDSPDNRIRLWTQDGESPRIPLTISEGGYLIDGQQLYDALELMAVAEPAEGTRTIRLFVEGVKDSFDIAATTIQLEVFPDGNASQMLVDRVRLSVGSPLARFDWNRDANIEWTNTSDYTYPDDGQVAPERTLTYRFWKNDDEDGLWNVERPLIFDDVDEETDDEKQPDQENHETPEIDTARDLEDFVRLNLDLPSYVTRNKTAYQLGFKMLGAPQIRLFQGLSGRGYLYNERIAHNQLNVANGPNASPSILVGSDEQFVSVADYSSGLNTPDTYFIFEGVKEGKATLQIRIYDVSSGSRVLVAEDRQWVSIDRIENFYEVFSVGGDAQQDQGPNMVYQKPADSYTFPKPDAQYPWEQDYILAVHGYQNDDYTKKVWFMETMVKRLWHLGYRGRFGLYSWPAMIDSGGIFTPQHYDDSDFNAWRSGYGLRLLLRHLNERDDGAYSGRIRIYGHSQGNVVIGQSLLPEQRITVSARPGSTIQLSHRVVDTPMDEPGEALPAYHEESSDPEATIVTVSSDPVSIRQQLADAWNGSANQLLDRTRLVERNEPGLPAYLYPEVASEPGQQAIVPMILDHNIISGSATVDISVNPRQMVALYIASQAAIAAHCWDPRAVGRTDPPIEEFDPSTPNVRKLFPGYPSASQQRHYFKNVEDTGAYAGSFYRYFNPQDNAVGFYWEVTNRNKPDVQYVYSTLFGGRFSRAHPSVAFLTFPSDTFEIFSYAAEARSRGLGVERGVGRLFSGHGFNMETHWGFNDDPAHHSYQFFYNLSKDSGVGDNARGINWRYWLQVATDFGLPNSTITP